MGKKSKQKGLASTSEPTEDELLEQAIAENERAAAAEAAKPKPPACYHMPSGYDDIYSIPRDEDLSSEQCRAFADLTPPPPNHVSDDELARCVSILERLDMSEFDTPRFRPLRRALRPAYEAMRTRHFGGGEESSLEYGRRRQLRIEAAGRKARQAELDKHHRDTTALRSGRIHRLRELCERDGGGVGADGLLEMRGADGGTAIGWNGEGGDGDGGAEGDGRAPPPPPRYLMQVPDGAVTEAPPQAERAPPRPTRPAESGGEADDDASQQQQQQQQQQQPTSALQPAPQQGAVSAAAGAAAARAAELYRSHQCYTCKARFARLHHFYAQLCPACAALNFRMRRRAVDLRGRVALLTGSRVKIGFEIGLKLLRAGATLVATTRFPADAAARYAAQPDFGEWRHRLQLHAVDLRDVGAPAWPKWPSWRGHSWPPRAHQSASEGLGLPSALVRRGLASQMAQRGRGLPARGRPS